METIISVDENELNVKMMIYDSDLQVVALGTKTSKRKVEWIRQESSSSSNLSSSNVNIPNVCTQQSCGQSGINSVNISTNNKDKEELPLKFEIPHKLLEKHIHQASMGLWLSFKIK